MTKIAPGSQGLTFDRGIESITYARDQADMSMPERSQSAPPEGGVRAQLAMLLERQTLDDSISAAIRPNLPDRDLLVPVKFREALDGALHRLKEAAASQTSSATNNEEGGEKLRLLNRATRLLSEESDLRDLVQMYRSALYQG
ncbi:MAG: hypothetical protein RR326_15015 [Stenotrophomonas sp.]